MNCAGVPLDRRVCSRIPASGRGLGGFGVRLAHLREHDAPGAGRLRTSQTSQSVSTNSQALMLADSKE